LSLLFIYIKEYIDIKTKEKVDGNTYKYRENVTDVLNKFDEYVKEKNIMKIIEIKTGGITLRRSTGYWDTQLSGAYTCAGVAGKRSDIPNYCMFSAESDVKNVTEAKNKENRGIKLKE
jgi:hypothetical protein